MDLFGLKKHVYNTIILHDKFRSLDFREKQTIALKMADKEKSGLYTHFCKIRDGGGVGRPPPNQ